MKSVAFIFCLVYSLLATSQEFIFSGQIRDKGTSEPLPQAAIWNFSQGNGTVSNNEGYFQLPVLPGDSIVIRYVGYKMKSLVVSNNPPTTIYLQPTNEVLAQVSVRPKSTEYLYDLVNECRKTAPNNQAAHKAYYETSTFLNGQQLELVEGFYNAHYTGYGLDSLIMCMGRVGWRAHNGQYFLNLETSKSYIQLNPTQTSKHFPTSPLQQSKRKNERTFILWEKDRYLDNVYRDTVVAIQFAPKDSSQGEFFKGTLFILKESATLLKEEFQSTTRDFHPFLPLFPSDQITKVELACSRVYEPTAKGVVCVSALFDLGFDYQSERSGFLPIKVKTSLTPYARNQSFLPPLFPYVTKSPGDYERIQLLPYQESFWLGQRKFGLPDVANQNQDFLNNPLTISNNQLNNTLAWKNGLFEYPYLFWNPLHRLGLKEFQSEQAANRPGIPANSYNLGIKILLIADQIGDHCQARTYTVIDPKATFYNLPIDSLALCFVNIWVDLVEVEREAFQQTLDSNPNWGQEEIRLEYKNRMSRLKNLQDTYLFEVQRGRNAEQLSKWNKKVAEALGRNHKEFFKIPE